MDGCIPNDILTGCLSNNHEQIVPQNRDLMDDSLKKILFNELNDTAKEYPKSYTICELFDEQVKKTPFKDAVVFKERRVCYEQLNEKVNQIANMLIDYGVKKGDIIGLMINRSIEMLQGILGILKSGAVCLPLDIKYPRERIAFILQDSGTQYILKEGQIDVSASFNGKIIDVHKCEEYSSKLMKGSETIYPENTAFVIYTSGSSGRPKGVLLKHRGIINHAYMKISVLNLTESDYLCHNFSINFVASIWIILTPLFIGAKLYICDEEMIINPYNLFYNAYKNQITIMEVIPSHLNAYLNMLDEGKEKINFNSLRMLILTGEKVFPEVVNKFYKNYNTKLINAYGQTECSDDTLHFEIPQKLNTQVVPIGRPSHNTRAYILDSKHQLQHQGVVGELYISGDGLATGYLNKTDLTRMKFIDNPYEPESLMYHTGDLARILPDGNIEYIGRADRQIKVRGYRIELDEIEKALSEHENIKEGIIVDRDDIKGNKYICAYYIANRNLTGLEVREFLSKTLPDFMIPSFFMQIDKVSYNPNGKLDRTSLPQIKDFFVSRYKDISIKNDIESILADAWRKYMEVGEVGLIDNFLVSGGDSIRAIQICAYLNKYGIRIQTKDVFMYPTIRSLGEYIKSTGKFSSKVNEATTNTESVGGTKLGADKSTDLKNGKIHEYISKTFDWNAEIQDMYSLSPSQEIMLFYALYNKEPKLYFEQLSLSIYKKINIEFLSRSFNLLIKRHDIFRTVFTYKTFGKPMQIVLTERKTKLYYEDISYKESNDIQLYIEKYKKNDKEKGFDVLKDILIRLAVFKVSQEEHKIILSFHHIILDGWGIGLLKQELTNIYDQIANDYSPYVEETYQYFRYIDWLNAQNKQEAFLFWERYLKSYSLKNKYFEKLQKEMTCNIKGHAPLFKEYQFKISPLQTKGIINLAINNKVTVSSAIFAIWGMLLQLLSQRDDIVFGIVISGRPPQIEGIDKMLGLFVNVMPVRINNEEHRYFSELMISIHEFLTSGNKYSYYPLIEIQRKLGLKVIDHVIGFQNYPGFKEIEDRSKVEFIEQSNYDLNVSIIPEEQYSFNFLYNTAIYNVKTFLIIKKYILRLLNTILKNPGIEIEKLKRTVIDE